ncbi:MAG: chromate efflux transporter, partial [bacterium]
GLVGFGGGVGMLALMRQEVVERRRWVSDKQMGVGVALGQMLPGPFVSNYAEYVGYELRGLKGMTVAVVALLAPSFVLMCLLSWLYFSFGSVPVVAKLFGGIQPVVVGILAWATWRIGRANIKRRRQLLIAAIAAVALLLRGDFLLVVLGCGALGIAFSGAWRKLPPAALAAVPTLWLGTAAGAGAVVVLGQAGELALVFTKVGALLFGGGFAAIPFIQHEVVDLRGWLTATEFIDGVALGQLTPGPVAITATFIGYKVLGLPGALIATLGTFVPSFFLLLGAIKVYARFKDNPWVSGFLSGVLPAVCGMLFSATFFLGRTAISGPAAAIIAALALVLLLRFRLDAFWLVLGGALLGLVR